MSPSPRPVPQANPGVPGLLDTPEGGANFRRRSYHKTTSTKALQMTQKFERRGSFPEGLNRNSLRGSSTRNLMLDPSSRSLTSAHPGHSLDSSSHHTKTTTNDSMNPRRRRLSSKIIQLLPSQELDAFLPKEERGNNITGTTTSQTNDNLPPMFASNNEWYQQATTEGIERYTVA